MLEAREPAHNTQAVAAAVVAEQSTAAPRRKLPVARTSGAAVAAVGRKDAADTALALVGRLSGSARRDGRTHRHRLVSVVEEGIVRSGRTSRLRR